MYIPTVNTQNYPFCILELAAKRLGTQLKSPQNCLANVIIKLWGIV